MRIYRSNLFIIIKISFAFERIRFYGTAMMFIEVINNARTKILIDAFRSELAPPSEYPIQESV
ncbi:MAG: hypothetical protein KC680_00170 [Candidatus Peregrinibacteria bacterium]|nr:hypothetical protein [Candidatus Peregrinibacteria bacterium]